MLSEKYTKSSADVGSFPKANDQLEPDIYGEYLYDLSIIGETAWHISHIVKAFVEWVFILHDSGMSVKAWNFCKHWQYWQMSLKGMLYLFEYAFRSERRGSCCLFFWSGGREAKDLDCILLGH